MDRNQIKSIDFNSSRANEFSDHSLQKNDFGGNEPFPVDTSEKLRALISRYKNNGRTQEVSFRKLVSWMKVGERATHYIHPYPAKLLPQIAHFFLACETLSKPGEVVLDPFGGTGTVALEAILSGRNAYYADANPFAKMVASVKTTHVSSERLRKVVDEFKRICLAHKGNYKPKAIPSVININYWYEKNSIKWLCFIKDKIAQQRDEDIRNFLLISFSVTCRKVSHADPRLSVPVYSKEKLVANKKSEIFGIFFYQLDANIRRIEEFERLSTNNGRAFCVGDDAKNLRDPLIGTERALRDESVRLIITSPPYAGAQKYIRASSLSLGWLDLASCDQLKHLESLNIGREHFPKSEYERCPRVGLPSADKRIFSIYKVNPLRAKIVAAYLTEMRLALVEMHRVLASGGYLILVIGNNEVCGQPFKSSEYLERICLDLGFSTTLKLIDKIKSRGLMTKRNKTASLITREWVLVLKKEEKEVGGEHG